MLQGLVSGLVLDSQRRRPKMGTQTMPVIKSDNKRDRNESAGYRHRKSQDDAGGHTRREHTGPRKHGAPTLTTFTDKALNRAVCERVNIVNLR